MLVSERSYLGKHVVVPLADSIETDRLVSIRICLQCCRENLDGQSLIHAWSIASTQSSRTPAGLSDRPQCRWGAPEFGHLLRAR